MNSLDKYRISSDNKYNRWNSTRSSWMFMSHGIVENQ